MKVNRDISDFTGNSLVVGCGHTHTHFFSLIDRGGIAASKLHPAKGHYTVSLDDDCAPDLVADFTTADTCHYLRTKQFKTICFEVTTGMLTSPNTLHAALQRAKNLLAPGGALIIFKSDRGLTKDKKAKLSTHFRYGQVYLSGTLGLWSAILSEHPIDRAALAKGSPHLAQLLDKLPLEAGYSFEPTGIVARMTSSFARLQRHLTTHSSKTDSASSRYKCASSNRAMPTVAAASAPPSKTEQQATQSSSPGQTAPTRLTTSRQTTDRRVSTTMLFTAKATMDELARPLLSRTTQSYGSFDDYVSRKVSLGV